MDSGILSLGKEFGEINIKRENMLPISIYLDDLRTTPPGFTRTYTVRETIDLIRRCQENHVGICVLSLDNDLGEGQLEGYKVLDWIEEQVYTDPDFILPFKITVHSDNASARQRMIGVIRKLYF